VKNIDYITALTSILSAVVYFFNMGKQKKTRKFAVAKKLISAKDSRM
jgi:hypothetical protein